MSALAAKYSRTSSDHNRLLLLALTEAWGNKCYWCRTPKPFRELQIDHIIPRRPRDTTRAEFDVDAVENLAPICGPCNQEKTNEDYQHAPRIESQLKLARSRAQTVQHNLDRFRRDAHVTKALLAITAADLDDEATAGAVKALGGVVLTVLRRRFPELVDAAYAEDYTVHYPSVEYKGRFYSHTDGASVVELDGASRRAAVILEDVYGLPLRYVLDTVRAAIGGDVDDHVQRWTRGREHDYLDVSANGRPSHNPIGVYFHEMRYENDEIAIDGEFDGTFTADIDEEDPDPERRTQSRGAAFDYNGEFTATFAKEGLIDIGISMNSPSESWWRRTPHSMELTD